MEGCLSAPGVAHAEHRCRHYGGQRSHRGHANYHSHCNVAGCTTFARLRVHAEDVHGFPGNRCWRHGGRHTCNVKGCRRLSQGFTQDQDDYGNWGPRCRRHGGGMCELDGCKMCAKRQVHVADAHGSPGRQQLKYRNKKLEKRTDVLEQQINQPKDCLSSEPFSWKAQFEESQVIHQSELAEVMKIKNDSAELAAGFEAHLKNAHFKGSATSDTERGQVLSPKQKTLRWKNKDKCRSTDPQEFVAVDKQKTLYCRKQIMLHRRST